MKMAGGCRWLYSFIFAQLACFVIAYSCGGSSNEIPCTYTGVVQYGSEKRIYFKYDTSDRNTAIRMEVNSTDADKNHTIRVVVRREHGVSSWTVPFQTKTKDYNFVSHNLCPDILHNGDESSENVTVIFSTSSRDGLTFTFNVKNVSGVELQNGSITFLSDPATSQFYLYRFPENTDTVLVKANSSDDICAYLAVQNATCPIRDDIDDVRYKSIFQTITTQGAITLSRDRYSPSQWFAVVVVVHPDDSRCHHLSWRKKNGVARENNTKKIRITVSRISTDYVGVIDGTIGVFLAICVFSGFFLAFHFYLHTRIQPRAKGRGTETELTTTSNQQGSASAEDGGQGNICEPVQTVNKKQDAYAWNILIVSVFYGFPVVQLVISYNKVSNQTGNQDECYFNFLCSKPLPPFSGFNNMFSNIGYVILGWFFLMLLLIKFLLKSKCCRHREKYKGGMSDGNGLYIALGLALVMEGVMSTAFHICPSRAAYQFDTAFMYIIACLGILKMISRRKPEKVPEFYISFLVFAGIIIFAFLGLYLSSRAFAIVFCVVHIVCCLVLSVILRYDPWIQGSSREVKKCNIIFVALGLVINFVLAGYFIYSYWSNDEQHVNFAYNLLLILIGNLTFCIIFYMILKCCLFVERCFPVACIFLVLSIPLWGVALHFFKYGRKHDGPTEWKYTPASSRERNMPCILFDFYDSHDLWHFLSACALFCSFIAILLMDEDDKEKSRDDREDNR